MPYVMLPVPVEHEEEFGQWLLGVTLRAKLAAWPDGAVAEAAAGVTGPLRDALVAMARGAAYFIDVADVAAEVHLDPEDLLAGLQEINDRCIARGWPALVMVRTEVEANGSTTRSLLMSGPARPLVLESLGEA